MAKRLVGSRAGSPAVSCAAALAACASAISVAPAARADDVLAEFTLGRSFAFVNTVHPGDVLLTGTPEGVGALSKGATIRATIDGIGSMDVEVR